MVTRLGSQRVEFRFIRPEAHEVFLVGDFNGWERNGIPMERLDNGEWRCQLSLSPGVYRFKYLADGEWFLDYASFGIDKSPVGWNSVLMQPAA